MSATDLQSVKNIVLVDCRWQKGSSILKNPLLAGMRYVFVHLLFYFYCMLSFAKTAVATSTAVDCVCFEVITAHVQDHSNVMYATVCLQRFQYREIADSSVLASDDVIYSLSRDLPLLVGARSVCLTHHCIFLHYTHTSMYAYQTNTYRQSAR
jgi:hypothetical protein